MTTIRAFFVKIRALFQFLKKDREDLAPFLLSSYAPDYKKFVYSGINKKKFVSVL